MKTQFQHTIKNPIYFSGTGLHSGANVNVKLCPAAANNGIIFRRTDLSGESAIIHASYENVHNTILSTNITNYKGAEISTIEHLMSALWAYSIDNLIIDIDGGEIPVMDGSAKIFVKLIKEAGIKKLDNLSKIIQVTKKTTISDNNSQITLLPSNELIIDMTIDFNDKLIGKQNFIFSEQDNFENFISPARTFGFFHEIEMLRSKGLAKGGSLDNAIIIKDGEVLNPEGLRYKNEFVRHKILDSIGDFYLCGGFLKAKIIAEKSGHKLNNLVLRELFATNSYKIIQGQYSVEGIEQVSYLPKYI